MKFSYKFSNLAGTVYKRGNIIFSSKGDLVFSPVGNRVTVFDLKSNKTTTLPFENRKDVTCIALSPDDSLLLTVDEDGKSILGSLRSSTVLHHFSFKSPVRDLKFSPNGKYLAATIDTKVQVWFAPGHTKDFSPVTLHRTYTGQYDDTVSIDWTSDSKFFVVGSRDMTVRIFSIDPIVGFVPVTLTGHRNTLVNCFFEENSLNIYSVSSDGAVFVWSCQTKLSDVRFKSDNDGVLNEDDEELQIKWKKEDKYFFNQNNTELTCAAFHKRTKILTAGFSSGIFTLHELPEFNLIHSLSISHHKVSTIAVNPTGEWLAFGCSTVGQLLVWEWQSESYILKQQGHYYDMNVLAYSPDGQLIVTGGDDGKVKVWNTATGFCFVTFHEHTAGISGVHFISNGQVIVSASLDGTVRAFDLNRYRNFRTFASPRPAQFSCLAVDSSGEVISAGSLDTFEIFLWSMQTGRLLEVIAGHEAPVCSLCFSSSLPVLISGSWDKTVKVWDVYSSRIARETFTLNSDVVAVTVRPDGRQVAVATLDGQLTFWDISSAVQLHSIEGRKDLGGGRKQTDRMTAKTSSLSKCFTNICYTADGSCVLAGGKSKFVCIYNVKEQMLMKKFEISSNRSFDAMQEFLDSRRMTEAGPLDLIDDSDDDGSKTKDLSLPGVRKGDMSSRQVKPDVRVKCVKFSPTGRAWSAATTEGLLTYSLDVSMVFDPYDLSVDVNPDSIKNVLKKREYSNALMLSFRLNEQQLILEVVESIPPQDIQLIVQSLSSTYVDKLLGFVATQLEQSKHLQFYLLWCHHLLTCHGTLLKQRSASIMPLLRALQKTMTKHQRDLGKLCDANRYNLQYILETSKFTSEVNDDTNIQMDIQISGKFNHVSNAFFKISCPIVGGQGNSCLDAIAKLIYMLYGSWISEQIVWSDLSWMYLHVSCFSTGHIRFITNFGEGSKEMSCCRCILPEKKFKESLMGYHDAKLN